MTAQPSNTESIGLHEAFDRVHDGARIIDADRTALAAKMRGRS